MVLTENRQNWIKYIKSERLLKLKTKQQRFNGVFIQLLWIGAWTGIITLSVFNLWKLIH